MALGRTPDSKVHSGVGTIPGVKAGRLRQVDRVDFIEDRLLDIGGRE